MDPTPRAADSVCCVCLDALAEGDAVLQTGECGHVAHAACAEQWTHDDARAEKCPMYDCGSAGRFGAGECAICLEVMLPRAGAEDGRTPVAAAPCGHVYHRECVTGWMLKSAGDEVPCPTCRATIGSTEAWPGGARPAAAEVCSEAVQASPSSAYTEPAPTEPAPTEPAPTEPAHTEPAHTEPVSAEESEEDAAIGAVGPTGPTRFEFRDIARNERRPRQAPDTTLKDAAEQFFADTMRAAGYVGAQAALEAAPRYVNADYVYRRMRAALEARSGHRKAPRRVFAV
jgi:hypothetical protein